MKTKIKVNLKYIGGFTSKNAQEYKITKIIGAPVIEVEENGPNLNYGIRRVGEIITETQATELAKRVELTTSKE